VLRALELNCDYMVKGTKVDGVYDKDPAKYKDAKKFDVISVDEALKRGLRVMDQSAIALAKDEKLPIFVCKIEDIDKIGSKKINGTLVTTE
jgi:uridylate kinase